MKETQISNVFLFQSSKNFAEFDEKFYSLFQIKFSFKERTFTIIFRSVNLIRIFLVMVDNDSFLQLLLDFIDFVKSFILPGCC